jgi:hypothetical protein
MKRWTAPLLGLLLATACKTDPAGDHKPGSEPEPSKLSGKAKQALVLEAQPSAAAGEMPDWAAAFKHEILYDAEKKAVVVAVELKAGFHAYTVGETIGKPLELEFSPDSPYQPSGDIQYPTGETKDLPIGKSVIVFGKADIVAPVAAKEGASGSAANGKFQYQVCTEEACDRPRTVEFSVNVPTS